MKKLILLTTSAILLLLVLLGLSMLNGCQKNVSDIEIKETIYDEDKPEINTNNLNSISELIYLDRDSILSFELLTESFANISYDICENVETLDSLCFYWEGSDEYNSFVSLKEMYSELSDNFKHLSENLTLENNCKTEFEGISSNFSSFAILYNSYDYKQLVSTLYDCSTEYYNMPNVINKNLNDSIISSLSTIDSLQTLLNFIFLIEKSGINFNSLLVDEINNNVEDYQLKSSYQAQQACPKCKTWYSQNDVITYTKTVIKFSAHENSNYLIKTTTVYSCTTVVTSGCCKCKLKNAVSINPCPVTMKPNCIKTSGPTSKKVWRMHHNPGDIEIIISDPVILKSINLWSTSNQKSISYESDNCPCINCAPDPDCHEGGEGN